MLLNLTLIGKVLIFLSKLLIYDNGIALKPLFEATSQRINFKIELVHGHVIILVVVVVVVIYLFVNITSKYTHTEKLKRRYKVQ